MKVEKIIKSVVVALIMMFASNITIQAQNPSREYVQLVKEYMQAANTKETLIATIAESYKSMNLPVKNVNALAREIIDTIWDRYIEEEAKILQEYYSAQQLRKIIDFYKTPEGLLLAKYSPQIAIEGTKMMETKFLSEIQSIIMKNIN